MSGIRWSLVFTAPLLVAPVFRAWRYFRDNALADVDWEKSDLQTPEGKRFRQYYAGTAYLGLLFETLHGRVRDRETLARFARLAALAAHFDDLSDLPLHQTFDLIGDYEHPADPERRAQSLLIKVRSSVPEQHVDLFEACLERVYRIETTGRQKNNAAVPLAELSAITSEKGACSVLLFRCLIDWPLTDAEKQSWWTFGSLIQRCDDAFDVWFDRRDGIQTPASVWLDAGEPETLQNDFLRHVRVAERAFEALPVSGFRKKAAWNAAAAIAALGRVCTNRYVELQKKLGTLPLDNRKYMVTDMGKWNNRIRALWNWVVG